MDQTGGGTRGRKPPFFGGYAACVPMQIRHTTPDLQHKKICAMYKIF
jgi:hypothetical protein